MADHVSDIKPWSRLLQLFRLERREITSLYIFALLVGLFSLAVPLGVQALVGMVSGGLLLQPAVLLIIFVVVGSGFTGYLQWMQLAVVERIQQRIFVRASFQFAQRIPRWRLESIANAYTGEIPNRFFDVLNIQKGMAKVLMDFITAALQFFFGMVLLTFYHPYFIVFGVVMILLIFAVFRLTSAKALRTSLKESTYKYKVAYWLQNLARVLPHHRLYQPALSKHRTDDFVAGYLKERQAHFNVVRIQYASLFIFKTVVIAGLLTIGSILVVERQISLGQFVASELIVVMVLSSVEKLVLNLDTVYDLLTGLEKVGQVTDIPTQRETCFECLPEQPGTGLSVRAEGLTLHDAEGMKLLEDAHFMLKPGAKIGVISDSPEATRTLIQLLAGVRDAYEGLLSLDGFGLRELTLASMTSQVSQAVDVRAIFEGTVAENLSPDGSAADITRLQPFMTALAVSDAIERLPGGLAQPLRPAGLGIDPRLAARILLVRAVADGPRLLLIHGLLDTQPQGIKEQLLTFLLSPQRPETLLISSYDPQVLLACQSLLIIRNGKAMLYDNPREGLALMEDQLMHPIPEGTGIFEKIHANV